MKCFNCGSSKMKTIYPKGYVQKKCMVCGWKNYPTKIPIAREKKKATELPTKFLIDDIFNENWWKL